MVLEAQTIGLAALAVVVLVLVWKIIGYSYQTDSTVKTRKTPDNTKFTEEQLDIIIKEFTALNTWNNGINPRHRVSDLVRSLNSTFNLTKTRGCYTRVMKQHLKNLNE